MPSTCVVPNCSSKIGGHKFPRDRIIREKWVAAIRRANFVPSEYSIVCKKHFNKEDYRPPKESVLHNPTLVLKKDSVPSKFSWNEYSLAGKIRSTQRKLALSQRCSVLQCKSASSKNVTLHTCPNQESVRKKWAEVFKVNRDIVKNMLICSQHFLNSDYIKSKNGASRTLKQNAVPSQKLPRSTRVIQLRKSVQSKKKIIKPKTIKKEEKMTEAVEEENKLEKKQEVRECRACLKRMESNISVCNIFQSWAIPWAGMESTIAEDLAKLANVEISDVDNFSKVICEPCYQKLLEASSFAAKVRSADHILRLRLGPEFDYTEKVWPKPIQVDKNINGNILQEMDIEIKQEIVSDAEYDDPVTTDNAYVADNSYTEQELGNMEIKIEPEEIVEPSPLTITINCTMSLNPSNPEDKTLINGSEEYEAIISDSTEHAALINGTDHLHNEQFLEATVKEEPQSEEEDLEHVPDLSLDCLLCTKSFNSVTGLKAHVIAQHSYKSVKRKAGSGESPEKKQKDEYKCEICRRCFTTSTDLMVHETCHNKHSCYGCSRKFDTFKQLTKHRKRCRVPLSQTAQKPKTLDDVIRPVKEERLDSSDVDNLEHNQEDSKDNSMKLHLEIHSAKSEAQPLNSDTHPLKTEIEEVEGSAAASNIESVSEDCST